MKSARGVSVGQSDDWTQLFQVGRVGSAQSLRRHYASLLGSTSAGLNPASYGWPSYGHDSMNADGGEPVT